MTLSNNISSIKFGSKITKVPDYAFKDCVDLSSVNIPTSVASIGDYAFYGCRNLNSVIMPISVTSIGDYCFYGCSNLNTITIPNSVTSIGGYAFCGCSKLNSVIIPASVTSIGDYTFYGCSSLISASIPQTVTFIGNYAFYGCKGLIDLNIPTSVTSINNWTFGGCSGLTSVTIPDQATSIGENAFNGCIGLKEIFIPNLVTSIADNAFFGCTKLMYLRIKSGDTPLELPIFQGVNFSWVSLGRNITNSLSKAVGTNITSLSIETMVTALPKEFVKGCSSLTKVDIPNSVKEIGHSAFADCSTLKSVTLSHSITSIADSTFVNCKSLSEVVLPPHVETIGNSAFANNIFLDKIVMGCNIKTIGANAFHGADASNVFITAQVPPTAPNSTFNRYSGKLHVQGETTVEAYYDALTCWDRFDGYAMSEPESLTMEKPSTIEGKAGEQFTLKATLTPVNVDLPYVFWRSTDPTKAYVDNDGKVTVLQDITAEDNLEIIAETLYHNGPVAKYSFYPDNTTGVDDIVGDTTATMDVFTLQGVQVLRNATREEFDNLARGIYIVRSGKDVKKVVK